MAPNGSTPNYSEDVTLIEIVDEDATEESSPTTADLKDALTPPAPPVNWLTAHRGKSKREIRQLVQQLRDGRLTKQQAEARKGPEQDAEKVEAVNPVLDEALEAAAELAGAERRDAEGNPFSNPDTAAADTAGGSDEDAGTSQGWSFETRNRPNRAQRRRGERWIRQQLGKKAGAVKQAQHTDYNNVFRPLGSVVPRTQVLVRLEDGEIEEELLLLSAVEQLKRAYDAVDFSYATRSAEIAGLYGSAWFLKRVHVYQEEGEYERLLGLDVDATIAEPDPLAAAEDEKNRYDAWFAAEISKIDVQMAAAQEAGIKDLKLPKPEYLFAAQWAKTNGYVWALADHLGLQVRIPQQPLEPTLTLPGKLRRRVAAALATTKLTTQPFLLFDLEGDPDRFRLIAQMGDRYPGVKLVPVAQVRQVANRAGDHALAYVAFAAGHPNCQAVVTRYGTTAYAAWAADQANVFQLYAGANAQWEGIHTPNRFVLDRNRFEGEQLPGAFSQALALFQAKAQPAA